MLICSLNGSLRRSVVSKHFLAQGGLFLKWEMNRYERSCMKTIESCIACSPAPLRSSLSFMGRGYFDFEVLAPPPLHALPFDDNKESLRISSTDGSTIGSG